MSHEASPAGIFFRGEFSPGKKEKKKKKFECNSYKGFFLLKLCQSRQISTAKILKLL
jgi:hypothetical protein